MALALKQIHETPRPAQQLEPYLPAFLGRVIERCLEKSPERRFQRVNDLAAALSDQPAPAPAAEAATDEIAPPLALIQWRLRDSVLIGLGVLGLIAFLGLFKGNYPYGDTKFTFSTEQAAGKAKELVSRFEPQMTVTAVRPFLTGWTHWSGIVIPALFREGGMGWTVELERAGPPVPGQASPRASVVLLRDGAVARLDLDDGLPARDAPPEEKSEELRRAAVQYHKDILGADLSQSAPDVVRTRRRLSFHWITAGPVPETERFRILSFTREGLRSARQGLIPTKSGIDQHVAFRVGLEQGVATVLWRGFTWAGLSVLLLLLFVRRRLYRGRAPGVAIAAAMLLAAAASVTLLGRPGEDLLGGGPVHA